MHVIQQDRVALALHFLTFFNFKIQVYRKGQLISKGLFGILNSSKKQIKRLDLTTIIVL
jgi:hypothetical protein